MNSVNRTALGSLFLLALAVTPALAQPENASVVFDVEERAGPASDYPVVSAVPAGATVTVYGCLISYDWCDIDWYGNRGWVTGSSLEAYWQSQRVPFVTYAPRVGVPRLTFNLEGYWGSHYSQRPWYAERYRWGTPYTGGFYGGLRTGSYGSGTGYGRAGYGYNGPRYGTPYARPYMAPAQPRPRSYGSPYAGNRSYAPTTIYAPTYAPSRTYAPTIKKTYAPTYNYSAKKYKPQTKTFAPSRTFAPTYAPRATYAPNIKRTYAPNYKADGKSGTGNRGDDWKKGPDRKDDGRNESKKNGGLGAKGKSQKCKGKNGKSKSCAKG